MISNKFMVFITFCSLTFITNEAASTKVKVFTITSNTTMQRKLKNILPTEISEGADTFTSFNKTFTEYLRSSNEKFADLSHESTKNLQNVQLDDVYISTCDTYIRLENVNFVNFMDFNKSSVEVETKIGEKSNLRNVQINCWTTTNTMTLTGAMIFQDRNYTFTADLTNPTFRIEEQIIVDRLHVAPVTKEQFERFAYDAFTITVQPKDMNSVTLKKSELQSGILQRLADSWLPAIAESLITTLMQPKTRQYEEMAEDDYKTLFISGLCNLARRRSDIQIPDSLTTIDPSGVTSYFESISLKNVLGITRCSGDSMVVKMVRSNSRETYKSRHNVSVVLNFENYDATIAATRVVLEDNSPTTESYSYRYRQITTKEPLFQRISCYVPHLISIQTKICFDVENGKTDVDQIVDVDVTLNVEEFSDNVCPNYSALKKYIENYLEKKVKGSLKI